MYSGPKPPGSGKGKKIAIICSISAAVIAIVLVLVLVVFRSGGGYNTEEEVCKAFIEAINNKDGGKMLDMMVPPSVRSEFDDYCKNRFGMDGADYLENAMKYDDDFEDKRTYVAFEVREDYDSSDLKDLEKEFRSNIHVEINIEEAKRVRIKYTVEGSSDDDYEDYDDDDDYSSSSRTKTDSVKLYKVDGKWFIMP